MTQAEFTNRTHVEVSTTEFEAINIVYMNCELYKDDFCKMWCKMNDTRVKNAIKAQKMAEKEAEDKFAAANIYWTLFYDMKFDEKNTMMSCEVLNKKERALVESFGIDVENSIVSNMLYNLSIKIGIK